MDNAADWPHGGPPLLANDADTSAADIPGLGAALTRTEALGTRPTSAAAPPGKLFTGQPTCMKPLARIVLLSTC